MHNYAVLERENNPTANNASALRFQQHIYVPTNLPDSFALKKSMFGSSLCYKYLHKTYKYEKYL